MFTLRPRFKPILAIVSILATLTAWSEPITFQRAIRLAIQHSPNVGVASADQIKAEQAYRETRNQYLPNLALGSGLGYSYGYPLSIEGAAPSIFNVNYQSTLYSPSLSDFSKSAKLEWNAAARNTEDQRKDAILDAAVTYLQLDKVTSELKVLHNQEDDANNLANIVAQRVQQGVASQVDLTRAKLVAARVHMRVVEMEGNADLLRTHISQLTGLPADSFETATESIPKLPDVDQHADFTAKALDNSLSLKVANQHAEAQELRAKGERKALYPSFDLVAQYGLFSNFNNYAEFFNKFQRNNATFGVGIRFPFLNFVQRAHAAQADAEAVKAKRQADIVKNQISSETLKLQRSVRQLAAAQQVAQLEYQLAQSDVESTQIRAETGTSPAPGQAGSPVTATDVSNARIQEADKYSQYLDTTFELDKARLQLLRATGELESWAVPRQP
jgi:outer membrane protein TolC